MVKTMRELLRQEKFRKRYKLFFEKNGVTQIAPCANKRLQQMRADKGVKK